MVSAYPPHLPLQHCQYRAQYSLRGVLFDAAMLYQQEGVMSDWPTLRALLSSVMYYLSPLLMLAGIAGFATCMALWMIRP